MKKIEKDNYELDSVINLYKKVHNKKSPNWVWGYRQAYLSHLLNYWRFTIATIRIFQEELEKSEKERFRDDDLNNKVHATSINSYNLMRICLKACEILSNNAAYSTVSDEFSKKLQKFRRENKKLGYCIVERRNKLGAHPDSCNCMVEGTMRWGSDGKVTFSTLNLRSMRTNKREIDIDPTKDLIRLKKYINNLMGYLSACWGI